MTTKVREFFAAVGHNVPLLKSGEYGVQVAPTSLYLLKTFEKWEKTTTRQIVLESVPPYPTIIIHVTYEGHVPVEQDRVRNAIKDLTSQLLHEEALGGAATWLTD